MRLQPNVHACRFTAARIQVSCSDPFVEHCIISCAAPALGINQRERFSSVHSEATHLKEYLEHLFGVGQPVLIHLSYIKSRTETTLTKDLLSIGTAVSMLLFSSFLLLLLGLLFLLDWTAVRRRLALLG